MVNAKKQAKYSIAVPFIYMQWYYERVLSPLYPHDHIYRWIFPSKPRSFTASFPVSATNCQGTLVNSSASCWIRSIKFRRSSSASAWEGDKNWSQHMICNWKGYFLINSYTGWGFQPLWKNISQLGVLFPIYGKKKKFQTTNQYNIISLMLLDIEC